MENIEKYYELMYIERMISYVFSGIVLLILIIGIIYTIVEEIRWKRRK